MRIAIGCSMSMPDSWNQGRGTGKSSGIPDLHAEGSPFPVRCDLPFCFDLNFYDIQWPRLFSQDRWNAGRDLHFALLFQTMDLAAEGGGRNPVLLKPVEVFQPALAARLDQPELFLRTCAFPAQFRSLHALMFFTASCFASFCYCTIRIPLCLYVFIWRAYVAKPALA